MVVQSAWLAPVSLAVRRLLPGATPVVVSMLIHLVLVGAALAVGLRTAPRLPPVLQAELVSIEHAPAPAPPVVRPPAPVRPVPPPPSSKPKPAVSLPRPLEVPVA